MTQTYHIAEAPVALSNPCAAADDIIDTATAHGYAAGDRVRFLTLTGGTGLTVGRDYYVIAANLAAQTFQVSTTSGGSAVNFTTDITAGTVSRWSPLANVLRKGGVELTEVAELGRVGSGVVPIDDPAGTLDIIGHRAFRSDQDSCSVVRGYTGYFTTREYGRSSRFFTDDARQINANVVDLNARLGFRFLRGATWNRGRETIATRLTALLADATAVVPYFGDYGFVSYPTDYVDKADCRNLKPNDVLREMADRVGYNFFLYWSEADNAAGLWFQDSNTSYEFLSTLEVSNLRSEIDGSTVFAASADTTLTRDPTRVVSRVVYSYKNGNVLRTRAATETEFEGRDGAATNSYVTKRATANAKADRYLEAHSTEEDRIKTRIRVPKEKVNLVRAGQLIRGRFTQYRTEGYDEDHKYFRVVERTIKHVHDHDEEYDLPLVLVPAEGYIYPFCGTLDRTASGDYWPLGGSGGTPNASDGVVQYWRPGLADPIYPIVGEVGAWNFPAYGAGGSGTIDYAGDAVQNVLFFCVVGDGTALIQTETYSGSPRTLTVRKLIGNASCVGGAYTAVGTVVTGSSIEVTISGTDDTDAGCPSWIKVTQEDGLSGGKFGWSQMTWKRTL